MPHPTLTISLLDLKLAERTGIYVITPHFAKLALAKRNEVNRTISPTKVEQLVSDILAGRFVLNGESLVFDNTGQVTDGQHRLTAVAMADKPVLSAVVMGVKPETKTTVDQGMARTVANYLQISGYHNSTILGSIAGYLLAYAAGDGSTLGSISFVSKNAITAHVAANPHLQVIATWAVAMRATTKGHASIAQLGIARALLEPIYGQPAVEFLERVGYGDNIGRTHAAYTVRVKLSRTVKPSNMLAVELMMRAFLAHRQGHSYTKVSVLGALPKLAKVPSRVRSGAPVLVGKPQEGDDLFAFLQAAG